MTKMDYLVAGIFVLVIIGLALWVFKVDQSERSRLRKMLPGYRFYRKRIKKNNPNI
ncbi:hypothetical protein [Mucilaginibacter phyllosphaerae]|uniref:Protein-S-isoprenylcysteine O-methyltransferase Ste14 n=1 Tax=Mucilaginibacter phyllosphaerae TaxID=1812349 RepID=A0ABR6I8T2_9SPHI|nr:hypothetical protein [Mucilaginibacter phyllosphaerae]MBB3969458.1 protein-S-isoprenylcysteine O-methyltransferase Ste14 [Mucilaginibacter phyllosphaerae]GGH08710.1 hypothetical protein GCM10007352_13880 [Mucilaginibacter phyllosphaerae]